MVRVLVTLSPFNQFYYTSISTLHLQLALDLLLQGDITKSLCISRLVLSVLRDGLPAKNAFP